MPATDYTLSPGTHATPDDGRCAMEWVSHLAGEPHSDAPRCVSPVLRAVCIALNDELPHVPRQRLRPYLARTIATADDGLDPWRSWLATDWLVRDFAAVWLRHAGLCAPARALSTHPAITDAAALGDAHAVLAEVRPAVRDARNAAFGAGVRRPSARIAALRAARAAAPAAWAGPGAGAWAAARLARDAGPQAPDVVSLVRAISGDAAAIAVRRVGDDLVCGPEDPPAALASALRAPREALIDSAFALLERMLPTEALDPIVAVAPAVPALG